MKKIVVGFDGTDQAQDALHLGAALARGVDAQLIVASAFEVGPYEFNALEYDAERAKYYEYVFGQARDELGDLDFEQRELLDSAAHGLTELAEDEQADLIVVGSTHHGPIGRVLAGTVAAPLFHGAPCAVLVAPRGWSRREHPGFGRIGVAYDGSDEAKMALATAEELAKAFDATLRVITIAPYVDFPRSDSTPVVPEAFAETLKEGVKLLSPGVETERVLRQGRAATDLALQGVELDLLVAGSRGYGPVRRTLIGSVSGELVRFAPCPVLVVPRGAKARERSKPAATATPA